MIEPKYELGQKLLIRHNSNNVYCNIVERVLHIDIDKSYENLVYGYTIPNSNLMYQSPEDTLTLYHETALIFKNKI